MLYFLEQFSTEIRPHVEDPCEIPHIQLLLSFVDRWIFNLVERTVYLRLDSVADPTRFSTVRSILLKISSVTEPERTASRETKPMGTSVSFRPTHKQNKAIWRIGTRNWMMSILDTEQTTG